MPGGGTIVFVSPGGHSYHPDPAVREEAGTPAIVESIRAGLVFALKDAVGAEEIRRREHAFARRALASWGSNPRIRILGNPEPERLAIVSFGIRHPRGLLHSNFVVALLSDLFGIQARSGCFCAGPYIHRAYPIDDAWSEAMHAQARRGCAGATLAFARVSFNYFISEAVFDYILQAVHLIADDGWRLLPQLPLRPAHGPLAPRERRPPRRSCGCRWTRLPLRSGQPRSACSREQLDEARAVMRADPPRAAPDPDVSAEFERIRWFPLPGEALASAAAEPRFRRAQPAGAVDRHHADGAAADRRGERDAHPAAAREPGAARDHAALAGDGDPRGADV